MMRKELITEQELLGMLRENSVDDPANVSRCYMESNGSIRVIGKKNNG